MIAAEQVVAEIICTQPANRAIDVPLSSTIRIVFNQPVDKMRIQTTWLTIPDSKGRISWNAEDTLMTFSPLFPSTPGATYQVSLEGVPNNTEIQAIRQRENAYHFLFTTVGLQKERGTPNIDRCDNRMHVEHTLEPPLSDTYPFSANKSDERMTPVWGGNAANTESHQSNDIVQPGYNQIEIISALSSLTTLQSVDLYNNQISNIWPLVVINAWKFSVN